MEIGNIRGKGDGKYIDKRIWNVKIKKERIG